MKILRNIILLFLALVGFRVISAPSITNVKAEPTSWGTWITYTLSETVSENDYALAVCASNRQNHVVVFGKTITGDVSLAKGTHVIQWYTVKDNILWSSANVDFKVSIEEAVQLWKDGPYWAKCNVGATKPEQYGHYFAWGATKISSTCSYTPGAVSGNSRLGPANDAATQNCGLMWRMPTADEGNALRWNTTMTWTNRNKVAGCLVQGKGSFSRRSIFLPAAGRLNSEYGVGTSFYYWTSDPCASQGKSYASAIRVDSSSDWQFNLRVGCLTIRPVLQISK